LTHLAVVTGRRALGEFLPPGAPEQQPRHPEGWVVSDDDEPIRDVDRYEWERVLRRCVLPQTVKTVAAFAAQYANRDGSRVYPGVARLSAVTCLSERSVRAALETLRGLDLLTRTRKGSSLGRQALTDEHKLTVPRDLMTRIHMLDVDESVESAACNSACTHAVSPARRSGDRRPVDKEHRHLTTGTPASGAGTPAPDDRNTGRRCTPPMEDHTKYPLKDQREDQVQNVSTDGGLLAKLIAIDELAARRKGA
jgi:hypothetical protein